MSASNSPSPESPQPNETSQQAPEAAASPARRSILIGSQRERSASPHDRQPGSLAPAAPEPAAADVPSGSDAETERQVPTEADSPSAQAPSPQAPTSSFPPPRLHRVSEDLQREIDEALSNVSLDALMDDSTRMVASVPEPETEARYRAMVVKVAKDSVFFSLPGHYEAVASVRQFDDVPEAGTMMDVVVNRYNAEENLYEVSVPGASIQVADWSDLDVGIAVEARVTGHNSGGLECEVNGIRGFIPVSQVSLYRVENLEEFVNEKFACIVTEANPARRNLVLSRRAYLEREQQAQREQLLASLQVGQTLEGVVRSIRDFGAFVDLGGLDGLIHISKLSWDRVRHPSEVLEEGQRVKVKVEKIDEATHKISLSYRDLLVHPWQDVETKYPVNTVVTGTVSRVMDFGAFVRLEAGIEGLVHISELAHHRVARVDKAVKEGDQVQVKVLSVDPASQRMSLSIKAAQAAPAAASESEPEEGPPEPGRDPVVPRSNKPLKGGTNRRSGGENFGLKW